MEERKTEVDLISEKPEQTGLLKYMLEKGITQFHVVKHGEEYLKEHIPGIGMIRPQASYLVFLDCRALGLTQKELTRLFAEKAHLALNDGTMFGQPGEGFMRLNIGCPRSVLKQALQQLREAVVQ